MAGGAGSDLTAADESDAAALVLDDSISFTLCLLSEECWDISGMPALPLKAGPELEAGMSLRKKSCSAGKGNAVVSSGPFEPLWSAPGRRSCEGKAVF